MPHPRQIRWAMFRVATLILVAVLILSVLFYLLTGASLFEQKAWLYIYIPDATGLGSGSPARVRHIAELIAEAIVVPVLVVGGIT